MSLFRRSPEPPTVARSFTLPQMVAANFASVGDPAKGNTSLQSIALRSTADLIASLVSELPVSIYRNGRRQTGVPGNLEDPGADGQGREDWLYRLMMSWLLRGNAYGGPVEYDTRTGRPVSIDLWNPDDVYVTDIDGGHAWFHKGRRLDAKPEHWRVNPQAGQLLGLSPVQMHAASIGISLSATKFGQQWFTDGAHPSGILANDADLNDPDGAKTRTVKAKFLAATQGSREPLVLGKGWKWEAIGVNPEESQFLATLGATEAQCARMFGPGFAEIMGYESGGSMTYANVVDRRQDLLVFSMGKWVRRADRVLTGLLPPSTQRVRLERDALLETTTMQRYQAHALALTNRWRTVNEVRQIEDLEPVPWGDEPNTDTTPGVTSGDPVQP